MPPTKSFPLPAVLISAPAANCSGYVMSPPGFGRSSSARAVMVVEVLGFSGLISGAFAAPECVWLADAIVQREIDRLLLPQTRGDGVVLLRLEIAPLPPSPHTYPA